MNRPPGSDAPAPDGDPWAAFGYLVAGVAFYGALGWGLSIWLHADYWLPIGIVVGLGFGMYMVFARYRFREPDAATESSEPTVAAPQDIPRGPAAPSAQQVPPHQPAAQRPARNDRGDTA